MGAKNEAKCHKVTEKGGETALARPVTSPLSPRHFRVQAPSASLPPMEARVESLQASAPKRREPCTGRESGWQLSRSLEDSEKPGDAYPVSSLLLRLAWPSTT